MAAASSNRRLIITLVIGGVAIALFAAYSLMSGGGDDDSGTTVTPPSTATSDGTGSTPSTTSTTAPGEPTLPNGEFDVFATRNPFEPSIQVTDTGADTGGTGETTPDTIPENATPVEPTTPASPDPSAGTVVAVIDVYDEAGTTLARVQVGSTVYTVGAGQVFATSYKVVSLSGTCGQFLFGDSPFSLCENEQVVK